MSEPCGTPIFKLDFVVWNCEIKYRGLSNQFYGNDDAINDIIMVSDQKVFIHN